MPKKMTLRELCLATPPPARQKTPTWYEKLPAELQREIKELAVEFATGGEISRHYPSMRVLAKFIATLDGIVASPDTIRATLGELVEKHG